MRIVVGSNNIPKQLAAEKSFSMAFPAAAIRVEGVSTDSGVSSHPTSASESIEGALNRVKQARDLVQKADFYVGIEGGLLKVDSRVWEIGWVAISDAIGKTSTGLSAGIEVKGDILHAIKSGVELNDVLEHNFGIVNAGNTNGFYGLATDDLVTRQQAYEQGIIFALAPFLHPEFYPD